MINQEWHQCSVCHRIFVRPEIEYKTDPYRSTVLGQDEPVWICQSGSEERQGAVRKTQKGKHEHGSGVFYVEKAIMCRLKAQVKRVN